jgi:hypothetical protein
MNIVADPPQWVYLLLAGLLVVTGALAAQKQDRRAALAFGLSFLLMLLVFVLDKALESPREEATRRVYMMQIAADTKNPDLFVEHVADRLEVQGKPTTREDLRKSMFWPLLKSFDVRVAVWGFSRDDVKEIDENTVEIGFMAKGEGGGKQIPVYCRGTFRKQPDGSYKMVAFKAVDPINRNNPVEIPNFP